MANNEHGYVYILTNPSFREDWVKIGKSSCPVDVRSKELDNPSVPLPFEIFATTKTMKFNKKDIDYGGMYTIQKYQSERLVTEEDWMHTKVELVPLNKDYETIKLDDKTEYRTVGTFK